MSEFTPAKSTALNGKAAANEPSHDKNYLSPLGEKIFLDRYAWKDGSKQSLTEGDTVIVCVDDDSRQREVATVQALFRDEGYATVRLRDGNMRDVAIEHIDKPIETTPEQTMARVARGIAEIERPEQRALWEERFRWLLEGWKFVPGGRTWAAAGTDQNLTFYNCYVIPSPHDSRGGIVETLQQMMEIMSRGGGVGINVSSLRPRYSYVKGVNGRSSGAVSWGGLYSFVTGLIEQGGSRRGALMLICNDWHPDLLEFIHSKREMGKITNANISVGLSDAFMAAVRNDEEWTLRFPDTSHPAYDSEWDGNMEAWEAAGRPVNLYKTVQAREVWHQIIESAWASAEPGLWFRERANVMSNSHYFNPLVCTNPCVTGDTLLYTAEGLISAEELYQRGNLVQAVIDSRFGHSESVVQASHVFRTGRKEVFKLQTREGYSLRATADHRIMTARGWVEMGSLEVDDEIHILNQRGGFGQEGTESLGRILGWLVGDGTVKQDKAVLSFFGEEKQELAPIFAEQVEALVTPLTATNREYSVSVVDVQGRDEARVASSRLLSIADDYGLVEEKHRVPPKLLVSNEAMQRGFLQALFTADGSFQNGGPKGGSIRLASSYLSLIEEVQRLLLNFGIASRIYTDRREAGYREMPDGMGGLKSYSCRAQHELVITKRNMVTFAEQIGFLMAHKQKALQDYVSRGRRGPYQERFTARVASVEADGVEDVYDITEPLTHSFIGNGIVLHNCGEQPLPAWGVCNLGAINLSRFVEEGEVAWETLGKTVRYAVRFLDNVIDATPYFFEENEAQQGQERRVGLGVMGLAEMLIRLELRYGSEAGNRFSEELFKFIAHEAYLASSELAAEKGSFSAFQAEPFLQSGFMEKMSSEVREAVRENGIRNVTLLTVAPTGTTGTMVGTSTGIEPYYFWSYFRKSRLGMHEEKVDVVAEWQAANPDQPLPDYFVTAMDLSPEEHVRAQAAVQEWVDSSISKTANVPNEYTVEQLAELYELMYDLGCKGGTVYRDGSRDEQVLSVAKEGEAVEEALAAPFDLSPNYTSRGEHKQARPRRLAGATYFIQTPIGKAYVTVNRDAKTEQPFEVFANVGKVGSEGAAMSEALGRLISLVLRIPSNISPNERLDMVISELEGIGGSRSIGFGPNRVTSLPDALSRVLREDLEAGRDIEASYLLGEAEPPAQQLDLLSTTMKADLCPECGHASFVRVEGCQKCYSCGHSEC